jgi:hypothetical protein
LLDLRTVEPEFDAKLVSLLQTALASDAPVEPVSDHE